MEDALFRVEGHWEVTGVGDLDDVCSDVTKDDVAEVQDIFWQLDSETVNKLSLPVTFPKERLCCSHLSPVIILSSGEEKNHPPDRRLGIRYYDPRPTTLLFQSLSQNTSAWALRNLKPSLSIRQSQRFLTFRGRDLPGCLDARGWQI